MKVRERHLPIGLEECVFVWSCVVVVHPLEKANLWSAKRVIHALHWDFYFFFVVALIFSYIHGSTE